MQQPMFRTGSRTTRSRTTGSRTTRVGGAFVRLVIALAIAVPGLGLFAQASAQGAQPALGQGVETPDTAARKAKQHPPPAGVRDLGWDDLIPKDWNPRAVLDRLGIDTLSDADPKADEVLAKIRADWDRAPVVQALDGQRVRLPGYVVMLNGSKQGVTEFLLVPYFGACIHLPPPPSSQVVHVLPARTVPEKLAMFPVWVIGTLRTVQADTAMGSAGYRIAGARVEAYPLDQ